MNITRNKPHNTCLFFKEGKSDKIYLVFLEPTPDNQWRVRSQWGRRGCKTLQEQIKYTGGWWRAEDEYKMLIDSKTYKGYKEEAPLVEMTQMHEIFEYDN